MIDEFNINMSKTVARKGHQKRRIEK